MEAARFRWSIRRAPTNTSPWAIFRRKRAPRPWRWIRRRNGCSYRRRKWKRPVAAGRNRSRAVSQCSLWSAIRRMRIRIAVWCAAAILCFAAEAPQPLIRVADKDLPESPLIIAYGDTRFTDPTNETATNPKVRRWLVAEISKTKPDLILVSGDLPWNGGVANDYVVYHAETAVWRTQHLLIT